MQLCAPANAVLPPSQPWHSLVLVRPPQFSCSPLAHPQLALPRLADGQLLSLTSWPAIFGLGVLAGAIVVLLTRTWLRMRGPAKRPPVQRPLAQGPQPASAPVAVAPARATERETETVRPEVVSMPREIPAEAKLGAGPPAGTVTAVRRLLADLEDLKVTLADGPPALVERLLTTAAAEIWQGSADREATWDAQGRREVILVGFDAHGDSAPSSGKIIRRESLGAALDLIASRTVTARRSLAEATSSPDQPRDADLGLTLLVSRIAPARSELSLLIDLVEEPGRVAALLPALGSAPICTPAGKVSVIKVSPSGTGSDLETAIAAAPEPPRAPVDLTRTPAPAAAPVPAALAPVAVLTRPPDAPASAPERRRPAQRPESVRPSPAASLRIGMLGQLTINGQPGALLPAQTQLIVALAVNGPAGLSNGQLCDLLGADADHPKPADSLRQLIARTRRQLGRADDGKEWIIHLGHGQYALHPDSRVDWREFQALTDEGTAAKDAGKLAAALSMIRGQPFTGCYYWWLDIELVDSVSANIVAAAAALAELALAKPDPASAARAARIGLVADATEEELWRLLMRAEHAAGNLAGVRDAWARCVDAVGEVAADGQPQRATAALYRSLTVRNLER
jgi:DNA-binding SARP family transcriptional activator